MTTEDTGAVPQAPTAIQLRQMEVDAYTQNIAVYQQILSTIDGNWDEDLLPFKNLEGQEAAKACPFDRISELIKTEIFERSKSQAILNALIILEAQNG